MKMKAQLASLVVLFASSAPLLSATEVERLRALCAEQEMQINQLELKISRLTDSPPPSRTKQSLQTVSTGSTPATSYTIVAGDNLAKISRKLGVSMDSLERANGITRNTIIHPGQKLKVSRTSEQAHTGVTCQANTPAPVKQRNHTIASGETFYKISKKYGVSVNQLVAANPSVNLNALRIGQQISLGGTSDKPVAKRPVRKPAASLDTTPSIPVSNPAPSRPAPRATDQPVKITKEITYGQFAANHGTSTARLDELNGLQLDSSTVLATGSELYIPAQP